MVSCIIQYKYRKDINIFNLKLECVLAAQEQINQQIKRKERQWA